MNVDTDNYSEVRSRILSEQLIEKAQIISFDLQFAGLKFQGNDRDRSEYLPAQKYQKMSAVARKYSIMQIGVTFFLPSQKSQTVTAHPFNFYVFPRPTIYADPVITLQSGCVSFNIANKMNWSRWIQKGITYMKLTEYQRINDIQEKARRYDELFEFLEDQSKSIVKQIIKEIESNQKASLKNKEIKDSQTNTYELPSASFYYTKKVIEKYLEQNKKNFIIKTLQQGIESKNKQDETIEFKIIKISQEQKQKIDNKKQQQLYGFTLLFQKIWNSGKIFVGHNCFFDLLFLYDAFIGALPYDYQLFKKNITVFNSQSNVQKMIPEELQRRTFYDTKFISNHLNFQFNFFDDSTSLESIYTYLLSNNLARKKIILPIEFQRYDLKNQVLHEAGFDSYLTGWVFYQMVELAKTQNMNPLELYKGKVNLNRSYFYVDFNSAFDGVRKDQRVFYIEVVEQKKYMAIEYIKKQRSIALKTIREILKDQNVIKEVNVHEGLKQVFIEIKQPKNYKKITAMLVKYIKQKKIKNVFSLQNFLTGRNAKEWMESMNKNINNGPAS